MTLQQLKYVSMVERCGSFSKAAQKLYVSQPSVSNLVHGLEEELGITIFERTSSGVIITNEGRELLKLGNKFLCHLEHQLAMPQTKTMGRHSFPVFPQKTKMCYAERMKDTSCVQHFFCVCLLQKRENMVSYPQAPHSAGRRRQQEVKI